MKAGGETINFEGGLWTMAERVVAMAPATSVPATALLPVAILRAAPRTHESA